MLDRRILFTGLLAMMVLTLAGIVGYMAVEGYSLIDAVYMTVITLSTVGFREVQPLSTPGKILTIVLIMLGFGMVVTVASLWTRSLLSGELRIYFDSRRRQKMLDRMKDHYIVCGYGHFGQRVAEELEALSVPFVVIDREAEVPERFTLLRRDATDESALREAGIDRARGLLITFRSMPTNVYATLTAHELNPDLVIVARSESPADSRRLVRAGATRTVSTYDIGGHRMAHAALNPRVLDFVDMVTTASETRMSVVEVSLPEGAPCLGKSAKEASLEKQYGIFVLGVVPENGTLELGSKSERLLEPGDVLVAFGEPQLLADMIDSLGGSS